MSVQRTIAKEIKVTGIGIHSGKRVTMVLHPAPANFGILFKRVDLPNSQPLKAHASNVGATENNTTIGSGVEVIHTVEHLIAVLYGLGIDNVQIDIDGPEVPIMDGSGASFVFLLKECGIRNLHVSKKSLVITKTVRVESGDKWAEISPSAHLVIDSTIVFAHPKIKTQEMVFDFSCENFINEICRARTFGFTNEVDALKRKGLIKGGSLNNAVVLDDYNVVNAEGLRYKDEFIRHKILDTIGDVSLLGHEIAGKITTYKSGHNIHNLLCKKLLETPDAYEIVSSATLKEEVQKSFDLPQVITVSH